MQPNLGPVERSGQDTSVTRENVEEIITTALKQHTVHRAEWEKEFWSDHMQEVKCVESERDKARKKVKILRRKNKKALKRIAAHERNAVVEEGQLEAIEKIMALERVTMAKNDAVEAWNDAGREIRRNQKEFDDMLAAKEAKIAHLESQLVIIHSLSKSDETAVSTSARCEDQTELASQEDSFLCSETSTPFSF